MSVLEGLHAVVTGAAGGMGRELAIQLAREGCNLALCDVRSTEMSETAELCSAAAAGRRGAKVLVTAHTCDVRDAAAVGRFRDEVRAAHGEQLAVLLNNAGTATSGSFPDMSPAQFDRCFDVSWLGVLHTTRAFLPMVRAASKGWITNLSSVNAFWSCLGPANWPVRTPPHAPYCAAKAAVRAFTEALHFDARQNFPHVTVCSVHPGHVGTDIARLAEDGSDGEQFRQIAKLRGVAGADNMTKEELQNKVGEFFRDAAPTSAAEAAGQILGGMRSDATRILVGEDAVVLDWLCRAFPRLVYEDWFIVGVLVPWVVSAQKVGKPMGLPLGRFALPALLALGGKAVTARLGLKMPAARL